MRRSSLAQLVLDAANSEIRLYGWQRRWLDDEARFRVLLKSRGVGGSYVIALESLLEALLRPSLILLVSYSQRQSLELFRSFRSILEIFDRASLRWGGEAYGRVAVASESRTQIELGNGSRVVSLPNNPDAIRGYRADHVYVDEAAMFRNDFEVKSAVIPCIVGKKGRLSLVSTPKGGRGWFHEAWSSSVFSRHTAHYSEAPHISREDLEGLASSLSDLEWQQEMEMAFLDESGALFPYELILSCVGDHESGLVEARNPVYVGVDVGRLRDSTVVTALERMPDGSMRVFLAHELRETEFDAQEEFLVRLAERLRPAAIAVDRTGIGLPLYERLAKRLGSVEGVAITHSLKEAMVSMLSNAMRSRKLTLPSDSRELVNQLRAFQRHQSQSGLVRYEAAHGQHDDYVMSLALAVMAAQRWQVSGARVTRVWEWPSALAKELGGGENARETRPER